MAREHTRPNRDIERPLQISRDKMMPMGKSRLWILSPPAAVVGHGVEPN